MFRSVLGKFANYLRDILFDSKNKSRNNSIVKQVLVIHVKGLFSLNFDFLRDKDMAAMCLPNKRS